MATEDDHESALQALEKIEKKIMDEEAGDPVKKSLPVEDETEPASKKARVTESQQEKEETVDKRKLHNALKRLTRSELEEMILSHEDTIAKWKQRAKALDKKCTDLGTVMKKYITDNKNKPGERVAPVRIRIRSVGLQVVNHERRLQQQKQEQQVKLQLAAAGARIATRPASVSNGAVRKPAPVARPANGVMRHSSGLVAVPVSSTARTAVNNTVAAVRRTGGLSLTPQSRLMKSPVRQTAPSPAPASKRKVIDVVMSAGNHPSSSVEESNRKKTGLGCNYSLVCDRLASLDTNTMSKEERRAIENTPVELQQRYDALRVMMGERCADLDSALVASQGVQDALANIAAWLDSTDKQLEQIMKPASLMRERLDEQIRLLKVLQSDVISHEPSINKMYQSAQQFIQNSSNVRETKKIESKVNEVRKKFETLVKTVQTREGFFNEISNGLHLFTNQVENFEVWYLETIDFLESRELLQMDADESAQKIDELVRRKDQMKPEFDDMIKNGKGLINKKDTTDKGPCTETIRELEEKWKELADILGERQAANRMRKQSLNAYEALREQVYMWLSKMEQRVEDLEPMAVDIDMLTKQINDLKPLTQEYTGYSKTIDKVNELGIQYDNAIRGSFDAGSISRRSSVSPRKPSMTPSLLFSGPRRPSASPKFSSTPGSPIRRESGFTGFQDASPIQQQLNEINNRYDMIGIRIGDRDRELNNLREEVKKYLDMLKTLTNFIEKQERAFPQEGIPSDKRDADKQLKVLKGILDQLYENQGQLDTAKVNIRDLLKRRPDAPGAEILDDNLNEIVNRWKELQERCKERANLLDEMKDFHDIHDNFDDSVKMPLPVMKRCNFCVDPGLLPVETDRAGHR